MNKKNNKDLINFLVKQHSYLREIESVECDYNYFHYESNIGFEELFSSSNIDSTKWNKRLGF